MDINNAAAATAKTIVRKGDTVTLNRTAGVIVRISKTHVDVQDVDLAKKSAELDLPFFMLGFTSWPIAMFWKAYHAGQAA